MQIPNLADKYVQLFCSGITEHQPVSITLSPVIDKPFNECFSVVPQHVIAHGGRAVTGWAIWEWPSVMIEAEFHMVWEALDKSLIDITPKPKTFSEIIFLPDSKKKYRGRQIDNIREPLTNALVVKRFIDTRHQYFIEMNKGDLANYHGEITPTPKIIKLHNKIVKLQKQIIIKFGEP